MKLFVVFMLIGIVIVGCVTTDQLVMNSYNIGRIAATAYLLKRGDLNAKDRKAIEKAYNIFNKIDDIESLGSLAPVILKKYLRDDIDNPEQLLVAYEAIDFFWQQITSKIDIDKLNNMELAKVLTEFRSGIRDVVTNYKTILIK